jgi:predicted SAM-dependent methyltransferase
VITTDLSAERQEALRRFVLEQSSAGINPQDPPALRLKKRLLPQRARYPLRVLATALERPWSARKLREIQAQAPVLLNIGSGYNPKAGWTNIDLFGAPVDVAWDLSRGIPFPDGSVDGIYHEHLMEHLTLRQGFDLCRECHRALRPGAILRIGVPDAGELLGSYAGTRNATWAESAPIPMLAVDALFYEHGHRAMYDGQLLTLLVASAGFRQSEASEFGRTRLDPVPDDPDRRDGTLYVEAVK